MPEPERTVVCENCGEIIETEPVPTGETDADRLLPIEDCPICGYEEPDEFDDA